MQNIYMNAYELLYGLYVVLQHWTCLYSRTQYKLQFGFLNEVYHALAQLLRVLYEIRELLDKWIQLADTIYLDFAKAFGRVDHQLLLKRLFNFGICGNLLHYFLMILILICFNYEM